MIALKSFFDWANVKSGSRKGEYWLELKDEFEDIAKALKTIEKILR